MAAREPISPDFCYAPWHVMELMSAFCLSASSDPKDVNPVAEEFYLDAQRLKADLDTVFSTENRREFSVFIKYINDHREQYRKSLLLWLDLVEEFSFEMEQDLGDGTGAVKLRRVRGAVFYLVEQVSKGREVPGIPRFLNRFALHIVIRATVEFIVSLVNVQKVERNVSGVTVPSLWPQVGRGSAKALETHGGFLGRFAQYLDEVSDPIFVTFLKWWDPLMERFVDWLMNKLLAPPWVSPVFKQRVDAIVANSGGEPVIDELGSSFFVAIAWAGEHHTEMRAAVDALAIAVHWTADMSDLTREERIDLIAEALILYFADIGLGGPLFREVVRCLVDIGLDAVLYLYAKRGAITPNSAN